MLGTNFAMSLQYLGGSGFSNKLNIIFFVFLVNKTIVAAKFDKLLSTKHFKSFITSHFDIVVRYQDVAK